MEKSPSGVEIVDDSCHVGKAKVDLNPDPPSDGMGDFDQGFVQDTCLSMATLAAVDKSGTVSSRSSGKKVSNAVKATEDNDLILAFTAGADNNTEVEDHDSASAPFGKQLHVSGKHMVPKGDKVSTKPQAQHKVSTKPKAQHKVSTKPKAQHKVSTKPKAQHKVSTKPKAQHKGSTKPQAQQKVSKREAQKAGKAAQTCNVARYTGRETHQAGQAANYQSSMKVARGLEKPSQKALNGPEKAYDSQMPTGRIGSDMLDDIEDVSECPAGDPLSQLVSQFKQRQTDMKTKYKKLANKWYHQVKYYEAQVNQYCQGLSKVTWKQNEHKVLTFLRSMAFIGEKMENFNNKYESMRYMECPDSKTRAWTFQVSVANQIGLESVSLQQKFHNIKIILMRLKKQFNHTVKVKKSLISKYNRSLEKGKLPVKPLQLPTFRSNRMIEDKTKRRARKLFLQQGAAQPPVDHPFVSDHPVGLDFSSEMRPNPSSFLSGSSHPWSPCLSSHTETPHLLSHARAAQPSTRPWSRHLSSLVGISPVRQLLEKLLTVQNEILFAENCLGIAQHLHKIGRKQEACTQMVQVLSHLRDIQDCIEEAQILRNDIEVGKFSENDKQRGDTKGPQNVSRTFDVVMRNFEKLQADFDGLKQRRWVQLQKYYPDMFTNAFCHYGQSCVDSKCGQDHDRAPQCPSTDPHIHRDPHAHTDPQVYTDPDAHTDSHIHRDPHIHTDPYIHRDSHTFRDSQILTDPYIYSDPHIHTDPYIHTDPHMHRDPHTFKDIAGNPKSSNSHLSRKKRTFNRSRNSRGNELHSPYAREARSCPSPSTMLQQEFGLSVSSCSQTVPDQSNRSHSQFSLDDLSQTTGQGMSDAFPYFPPDSGSLRETSHSHIAPPVDYQANDSYFANTQPPSHGGKNFRPTFPWPQPECQYERNHSYPCDGPGLQSEVEQPYAVGRPPQTECAGNNNMYSSIVPAQTSRPHDQPPHQTEDGVSRTWTSDSIPPADGYRLGREPPSLAHPQADGINKPYSQQLSLSATGQGPDRSCPPMAALHDHRLRKNWPCTSMQAQLGNGSGRSYSETSPRPSSEGNDSYSYLYSRQQTSRRDREDYRNYPAESYPRATSSSSNSRNTHTVADTPQRQNIKYWQRTDRQKF